MRQYFGAGRKNAFYASDKRFSAGDERFSAWGKRVESARSNFRPKQVHM